MDSPKLRGQVEAMSDPGDAIGPREPGGAESPMVAAGVKGGRSEGKGVREMGRGGMKGSDARGRSRDPHAQEELTHSRSKVLLCL